ncbi:TonB-dependent siderophore receptor [Shewanella avicenniae]|uniref:TonB-dependent siderophore receptor n=1 Tax=Shewanella avicenniae TaxID=2814294 RepID=A0ABX7QP67_9GAMM|nr:TonB-dependent siderophore receptor [Shewanella avicenniae]QSX33271.1 TonB-dependent siderophore receptor [Shewanella avicenniae]
MLKSKKFILNTVTLAVAAALSHSVIAEEATTASTADKAKTEVIVVRGDKYNKDGFRPKTVDLGLLGSRSIQDTPYAISVFNRELMDNVNATNLNDILKYMPSTQMEARGGTDVGRPQSRGMQGSVVDNNHLDGMNVVATTAQPLELLERVEVIQGLTGAIYGPASPAGNFNYVFKRPTENYFTSVTAGMTENGAWLLHTDTSGSPNEYFGYRINLLQEEGESYVSNSHLNRKAVGLAFDINPDDYTTIQLNGSYYKFDKFGEAGGFSYGSSIGLPAALDASKKGYGQPYSGSGLETTTGSIKVIRTLGEDWKLTAGILHQDAKRTLNGVSNVINADDTFTQRMSSTGAAGKFTVTSNMANLVGQVYTGDVRHDLVFGTAGYSWNMYTASRRATATLGTSPLDAPQAYDAPDLNLHVPMYHSGNTSVQSGIIGDTITWNEHWSTLLVGSYSDFDVENYNANGDTTGNYSKDGVSSTISMIYKPVENITTYVTYADTLEAGGSASTNAQNAGTSLDPVRSYQNEIGIKTSVGEFDINAALFRVKRPMAYEGGDGYYRQQGMQNNKGAELTVNGYLFEDFKIFSGVTYLDAVLEDAFDPATANKLVVGVPKWQGNLLMEYTVAAVAGLSFTGNVHYSGKRAANNINTSWASSYTTVDLGMKYVMPKEVINDAVIQLHVTNLFDRQYWAAIFPGNIYGSLGASNTAFLAEPRQLKLTATVKF